MVSSVQIRHLNTREGILVPLSVARTPERRRRNIHSIRHVLPPQHAAAHKASTDDALGDLDRPLDITPLTHEAFQDDIWA